MVRFAPFVSLLIVSHLAVGAECTASALSQQTMVTLKPATVVRVNGQTIINGQNLTSMTQADLRALVASGGKVTASSGGASAEGAPGDDDDEAEEKPVDPQFMQQFQQLQLDRRPSTMLKEWAKPDPLPSDEDPELKDPEDPEPLPDEPKAPEAPTKPERPADLVPPVLPEDVVQPVDGLAGLMALAAKKQEVAAAYPEKRAAYETALAAFEKLEADYQTAQAEYETAKAAFDEDKKAWDKLKKAFDKEKAKVDQKKASQKMKRIKRDIELFSRNVSLGRWDEVAETLALFNKQAKMQYEQMLGKISRSPQPMNGQLAPFQEEPAFEFDDIISLIRIAPQGPDPEDPDTMGPEGFDPKRAMLIAPLVRRVLDQGHSLDDWVARLRAEVARSEEERPEEGGVVDRRLAALLLAAQGSYLELGEFLPTMAEAEEANDREGLNLLAKHLMAEHQDEPRPETLSAAWDATMATLAPGEIEEAVKIDALKRAVGLAKKVREAKGENWLRESFQERPERGMEVLATIGAEASMGMVTRSFQPDERLEDMKLLRTAVDALLEVAPERAEEWSDTLTLVADTWLREAKHAFENSQQSSMGPQYERDSYGNIYWTSYRSSYNRVVVQPVEPTDLLEARPDGLWRESLPASLRPKIDQTIAELYLKVNEEALAFPYIRDLAGPNPKKAEELAKTFIEVWINNNDPNSSRNRTSIYNFSYGYNTRASGIPLTRSKQDRNLRDLAKWVAKLREIEGLELDSELLMRAFTQTHSQAEIYRVEVLEQVFGSLDALKPETLAAMTQRMRENLAEIWRAPDVQRAAKTNRKQKDIEAEVQRGYEIAQSMLARALESHPDAWQLETSRAALLHDLNNYRNDLQKSSDFSGSRKEALELFAKAARHYVAGIPELRTDEYSVEAFSSWFAAALGASDLKAVTDETLLASHEIPKIKSALDDLEGEAGEKHRAMFANMLFTRLSSLNPSVKNRYLEAGFDIVGDHPQARAARKVYDYYADLVTEIELRATIDGDTDVGQEPFGLRVDIRYTKEIGRESGGFSKYLQNQANAVNAYYNYGRPQENYRDKFEEACRAVLSEQFDVKSVTFNQEKAGSKAEEEYGWRRTSYAYILLQAKGPEVDRVPPLKLDLDFNDVTGYVVLPISSPVVPIDASAKDVEPRPYANVSVTQILDENKADEGILVMEVKAQAEGLVPELETLVKIDPEDFEVTKTEDQGVSIARFADDEETIISERLWLVEMKAKEGVGKPQNFRFAAPTDESIQTLYQRYDDADLMTAELEVNLEHAYETKKPFDWRWLLLIPGLAAVFWMLWAVVKGDRPAEAAKGLQVPDDVTPFTVLNLLQEVRSSPRIGDAERRDLDAAVIRIETHYFGEVQNGAAPDLRSIAHDWVKRGG
ncbi:hypothetical protein Poly30_53220 [Planctomycetes bacterium Poly30]|uniref:Uncharacterized protein n=1 Tax=Saltatorellus ferox TaxID=2528018 RepID=A0A518F096_9BACT|nr:hypothetical protein Poly30_53220 [Planctomycetes bacterium Poly30]